MKEVVAALVGAGITYVLVNNQDRKKRNAALADALHQEAKRIVVTAIPVRDSLARERGLANLLGSPIFLAQLVPVDAQAALDQFLVRAEGASRLAPALLQRLLVAVEQLEELQRYHRASRELMSVSPNANVDVDAYIEMIDTTTRTVCECIDGIREICSDETRLFIDSTAAPGD